MKNLRNKIDNRWFSICFSNLGIDVVDNPLCIFLAKHRYQILCIGFSPRSHLGNCQLRGVVDAIAPENGIRFDEAKKGFRVK